MLPATKGSKQWSGGEIDDMFPGMRLCFDREGREVVVWDWREEGLPSIGREAKGEEEEHDDWALMLDLGVNNQSPGRRGQEILSQHTVPSVLLGVGQQGKIDCEESTTSTFYMRYPQMQDRLFL